MPAQAQNPVCVTTLAMAAPNVHILLKRQIRSLHILKNIVISSQHSAKKPAKRRRSNARVPQHPTIIHTGQRHLRQPSFKRVRTSKLHQVKHFDQAVAWETPRSRRSWYLQYPGTLTPCPSVSARKRHPHEKPHGATINGCSGKQLVCLKYAPRG